MKTRPVLLLALMVIPLLSFRRPAENPPDTRAMLETMLREIDNMKGMSTHLVRTERIEGEITQGSLIMKVNCKPRKVYVKNIHPQDDIEVLWADGWNNNKAYIYPNGFPWVNVSLDPHGKDMMENQHHSLHELGFSFFRMIVSDAIAKHGNDFDKYVHYLGYKQFQARVCDVIEIDYPPYAWVPYTVKAGEDLFTIEKKLVVPAYMVMERNKLSWFDDVKPGQVILVPSVYSKKSYIWIDHTSHFPLVMEVWDEKGMFEKYEYRDLVINPVFRQDEFSPDFPDYRF